MGQYINLLSINSLELKALNREELYSRFFPKEGRSANNRFDLDKSLPGIQFVLSVGKDADHPYQNLLKGETILPLDDEDSGVIYQLIISEEINKINQLLSLTDDSTFEQNYDPLIMMATDIYPGIWERGKESYDYLYTHFRGLKKFISQAADDFKAIVVLKS